MPLPTGLIYDAAGHVILDPDTAIQGALPHLVTTFEAAGPPREGRGVLPAIMIGGRCGGRVTVRSPPRGSRQLPPCTCQRDGIENARPICAAIPGHTLDEHVGQLLIDTLTPLAVEAALQVSAELQQRAHDADALRAAHVDRPPYHPHLPPRRNLPPAPPNPPLAPP